MVNANPNRQDQNVLPGYFKSKKFDDKVDSMLTKLSLYRELLENIAGLALEENGGMTISHNAIYGMMEFIKEIDNILFEVHCAEVFVEPPRERWGDLAQVHPPAGN